MNRTVILACSQTKRRDVGEISALARYDGPAWRTLRTNLTCMVEPPFALSAEFGLISAYQEIPDYDRKLDAARAAALVSKVADQLEEAHDQGRLRGEIFVYGGKHYRELLEAAVELVEDRTERRFAVTYARGGIGDQLGQLKAFLTRTPAPFVVEEDLEDEEIEAIREGMEEGAARKRHIDAPFISAPDYTRFPRRCLICAALNPCSEHSAGDQASELARNDREIRRIRAGDEEAGR